MFYTDDLLYPGLWALAPTLGAGAVIYGLDAGNPLQRILALRPMAWIGDISYSLYLWHWPVAIFGAEFWPQNDLTFIVGGLILTFLLAMSAYYFVERPIHHMEPSKPIAGLTVSALGVGLLSGAASGLPMLAPPVNAAIAERIAAATADLGANYNNGCHLSLKETMQPDCRFGHIGGPRVVLFGDSHAAQWFTPLVKAADESGWELNAWTKTSCPTSDVIIWYPGTRAVYEECDTWRKSRYSDLRANPPELIIIGNFNNYYGWLYDKGRERAANRSTSEHLWQAGMARTAEALTAAGLRVVELQDTPRMYASYKNCLSNNDWNACIRPRDEALSGMEAPKIQSSLYSRLDFSDDLCSASDCPATISTAIAYRDSHHLTATQAALLYRSFLPLLTPRR